VHEFWRAGREFGDADHRALTRADVIVAFDKAGALRRLGLVRGIVDRHLVRRPYFAARDMRAPQPAHSPQPFVCLDDSLAVRIMPGDDPPYFQRHGSLRYAVS